MTNREEDVALGRQRLLFLLRLLDWLLPGRCVGLYGVGSLAVGDFDPKRSDLDFIAVFDRRLSSAEMVRLRLVHGLSGAQSVVSGVWQRRSVMAQTRNGGFVTLADFGKPIASIKPIASFIGVQFVRDSAFDVNPVMWKVLGECGVVVRGGELLSRVVSPSRDAVRAWNLANLNSYWQRFADDCVAVKVPLSPGGAWIAWGVLGAPRLHCTIATGEVISKRAAGAYAKSAFDARWHPLIDQALSHQSTRRQRLWYAVNRVAILRPVLGVVAAKFKSSSDKELLRSTGEFVNEVIRSASQTE
jgi:hypothetical protein